jgi:hypothetical protein
MASKCFEVDLSRFLNVEALDQEYETSSDDTDDGTPLVQYLLVPLYIQFSDFVENTGDSEICEPMPLQAYWDDSHADEAEHLAAIASDIQDRFHTSSYHQLDTFPLPEYPTLTDAPVWRVRVQVVIVLLL